MAINFCMTLGGKCRGKFQSRVARYILPVDHTSYERYAICQCPGISRENELTYPDHCVIYYHKQYATFGSIV